MIDSGKNFGNSFASPTNIEWISLVIIRTSNLNLSIDSELCRSTEPNCNIDTSEMKNNLAKLN